MSAETIARWNAIPMERPQADQAVPTSLKVLFADEDDSDDDISLVSRSPSPRPDDNAMDIDKYDEYVRGAEHEAVTIDTKIGSNNRGFAMLAKFGWVEGQPLGLSGDGRVDPIPFVLKNDQTGLGKANQDVRMIESTVSQRRGLDSERQTKENEEQRRTREETVAKRAAVQSEISSVLKPFYCELCDKQFKNVAQYDEHTNSYAHHHKARFRDMQAAQKASFGGSQEDVERRKEKERKREEKELRKIAKAAGIKMTKPAQALAPTPASAPPDDPAAGSEKASGFKKSGWATVGDTAPPPPPPSNRPGWSNVPSAGGPSTAHGGWAPMPPTPALEPTPPPPAGPAHMGPAPAFRAGGWSSLDADSTAPLATQPPPEASSRPHAFNPPPQRGGWAPAPSSQQPPPPPPPQRGGWAPAAVANEPSTRPSQIPPQHALPDTVSSAPQPARPEASRSGWQQFKAAGSRRR
ncbi:hypothetical protein EIP86_000815 [Pleurotus ostreatoroseus]|nr:hypothetical protein EIP86_000815 [Pleurotus ostreatoroseus]